MKRPAKQPLAAAKWEPDKWRTRCGWCGSRIAKNAPVFGISIALREEAFREFDPGTVQPLLLGLSEKIVPMLITAAHSPAKQAGKDAAFKTCSEGCAKALQTALKKELGGG